MPSDFKRLPQKIGKQPDQDQKHQLIELLSKFEPSCAPLNHRDSRQDRSQLSLTTDHEQKLFGPFTELVKDVLDKARVLTYWFDPRLFFFDLINDLACVWSL